MAMTDRSRDVHLDTRTILALLSCWPSISAVINHPPYRFEDLREGKDTVGGYKMYKVRVNMRKFYTI